MYSDADELSIIIIRQKNSGKTTGLQVLTQLKLHQRVKMSVGEGDKGTTNVPEAIGIYPRDGEQGHDMVFGKRVVHFTPENR